MADSDYTPTEREQAVIKRQAERKAARIPYVSMEQSGGTGKAPEIRIQHEDAKTALALLMESLGTDDPRASDAILHQLCALSVRDGEFDPRLLDQHLAFVQNLGPSSMAEVALAAQMAAIHAATMDTARRLHVAQTLQQAQAYEGMTNKLARTFTAQLEAMKRLRSGGAQKVVVEHRHYHLHQDAQGDATSDAGGGASTEIEDQSHVRSIPQRAAVLGAIEADRPAVPGTGDDRQGRVPLPRRESRSPVRAA